MMSSRLSSHFLLFLFFYLRRLPQRSPLFPYTTLFRSIADTCEMHDFSHLFRIPFLHTPKLQSRKKGTNLPSCLRSEEHTSELQSRGHLVCRLLLDKKKQIT